MATYSSLDLAGWEQKRDDMRVQFRRAEALDVKLRRSDRRNLCLFMVAMAAHSALQTVQLS